LPETLTLPIPLAGSVSKPKLSHSVKFYNHYHKEKTGKKESSPTCMRGKKARPPIPLKSIKHYRRLPWPCFFTAGRHVGSLHTFACFFCGFGSQVRRAGSAAIWRSPKYIMPVIGSRKQKSIPFKIGCV